MRGMGWGLIGVLMAAGWLLEAIGESAFTVVVWIVVGLILLAEIASLLAKIRALRFPAPVAPGQISPQEERRWQRSRQQRNRGIAALLAAVEQRDGVSVERLVLLENVSPYESGLFQGQRLVTAHALAMEREFEEAVRFFEAWTRNGKNARFGE